MSKMKRSDGRYWNNIAKDYNSLYADNWSKEENLFIQKLLKTFICDHHKILDLGCGTGLGYELCTASNKKIKYTGLDISEHMIRLLRSQHPEVGYIEGSMSNLSQLNDNYFDLIVSIFTSFSYTDDVSKTRQEMFRVLKPGGTVVISVLSKWSLRRIFAFKFLGIEKYKTRKSKGADYCLAKVFSKKDITAFEQDFIVEEILGYNSFGGINFLTKNNRFWNISRIISKLFPQTSHELIVILKKRMVSCSAEISEAV
ncbi:Ubiquinone/menaquinone biosynthesis C-methylase UbiE [Chryseobacterium rhizoplanae]|uniref:Ubiquinone/menaquinone biosynthesis C-methylase UbiE n=1 Tax=Chryseobacterium rhizoplanae TaxID=1609531 RepID=A0A521DLE7_9FLAO|nr:class I SAM-dependent methyltransferase [Chryseobacterium rhizoplanae]SMO72553.1 Ubiquinone/menaquinone biosynthesis C-methylase UbiE [Chryseobacterium rhizoplanae]